MLAPVLAMAPVIAQELELVPELVQELVQEPVSLQPSYSRLRR